MEQNYQVDLTCFYNYEVYLFTENHQHTPPTQGDR